MYIPALQRVKNECELEVMLSNTERPYVLLIRKIKTLGEHSSLVDCWSSMCNALSVVSITTGKEKVSKMTVWCMNEQMME